jgi:hypothetical protein
LYGSPLFGKNAPAARGWTTYLVTVANRGATPVSGHVRLESADGSDGFHTHMYARAGFSLAPGAVSHLQLPIHDTGATDMILTALDADGHQLTQTSAGSTTPLEPLPLDWSGADKVVKALQNQPVATRYVPERYSG